VTKVAKVKEAKPAKKRGKGKPKPAYQEVDSIVGIKYKGGKIVYQVMYIYIYIYIYIYMYKYTIIVYSYRASPSPPTRKWLPSWELNTRAARSSIR